MAESSAGMGKLSIEESTNMEGNILASNVIGAQDSGITSASYMNDNKEEWIVTNQMTYNKELLNEKLVTVSDKKVHLPNGEVVDVSHTGSCGIIEGKTISNVLCIPDFRYNLLSVSKITRELNCSVNFFPEFCIFQDLLSGKVLEIGREKEGLYLMKHIVNGRHNKRPIRGLIATRNKVDVLWHRRMGHASVNAMQKLLDVDHIVCKQAIDKCEICPLAKHTRIPFSVSETKTAAIFDLLHLDVWGPFHVQTVDGYRLFLTIVDDYSRMTCVCLLKPKNDVVMIKNFIQLIKTQFNKTIKVFRSDNGTEFVNSECTRLFLENGIVHQRTCAYTPQQNGVVERKHRYILEIARAIRFQGSIPLKFWGHCVLGAVYMMNRLPSVALKGKTPFEVFHGHMNSINHLRTLGCLCYAKKLPSGDKFEARAVPAVHMGYSSVTKGYVLYSLTTHSFFLSRDVIFKEDIFPFKTQTYSSLSS